MTRQELRERVYMDSGEATTGNDRVGWTEVHKLLNDAYREVSRQTSGLMRMDYVELESGVQEYGLPHGMFGFQAIWYGNNPTAPLRKLTIKQLMDYRTNWKYDTAGTPIICYMPDRQKKFGLYPKPSLTHGAFAGISSIARVSNVVTVTTGSAHGLTVGDVAQISGTANFNGRYIVSSAADTTHYTFSLNGANVSETGYSHAIVAARVYGPTIPLPSATISAYNIVDCPQEMEADDDEPAFADNLHEILVHWCVWRLHSGLLLAGERDQVRAATAKATYDQMLAEMKGGMATDIGIAEAPGQDTRR